MAVPGQQSPAQWTQIAVNAFTGALRAAGLKVPSTAPLAVFGAAFRAVGFIAFQLQVMISYVYQTANLLTCLYDDAVTLLAAWGFLPQSAIPATTIVNMGVNSAPTSPLIIPFGLIFSNGSQQYELVEDPTQSNYSPNGYVLAAGTTVTTGPVQCLTAGTAGNTDPNTIITLPLGLGNGTGSVITSVTNPNVVDNGIDQESLPSLIARFQAWIAGGNIGTPPALLKAALGTQAGLAVSVCDCLDSTGTLKLAWSTIFVNQLGNAGGPSSTLLANVGAQVEAVRSAGMQFACVAPTITAVNVSMLVSLDGTVDQGTVFTAISNAVAAYINGIGMQPIQKPGGIVQLKVSISQLQNAITGRDMYGNLFVPGIAYIDDLLLNGSGASVALAYGHQAVAGSITIEPE